MGPYAVSGDDTTVRIALFGNILRSRTREHDLLRELLFSAIGLIFIHLSQNSKCLLK
jgi:hypothetical protein